MDDKSIVKQVNEKENNILNVVNDEQHDKVTPDTIARTIILSLALLNQVLAIAGKDKLNIAESDIYQVVTLIATIGASAWSWWKNNSFTGKAKKADVIKKTL